MPARAAPTARERGVAGGGRRPLADRKDRQHAVADEFQHFAAEGVNGACDAVEPGVERGDHRLRRHRLRQLGEAAQIAIEQDRADGLAGLAPQSPGQHLRRTAPAEIGLEQRRKGRARGKGGERRRGKTRRLMQQRGFGLGEGPRESPAEHRACPTSGAVSCRAGDMLLHHARAEPDEPVAADIALLGPGRDQGPEAERLDHRAGVRPPQPGAAGDDRMRRCKRQRTAGERQAIGDQLRAERRQEIGRRRGTVLAASTSQARVEGSRMREIMRLRPAPVIAILLRKWISCMRGQFH